MTRDHQINNMKQIDLEDEVQNCLFQFDFFLEAIKSETQTPHFEFAIGVLNNMKMLSSQMEDKTAAEETECLIQHLDLKLKTITGLQTYN